MIIDGFDEEQIWQQIELQNEQVIPELIADISKLLSNKQLTQSLEFKDDFSKKKLREKNPEGEEEEDDNEEEEEEISDEELDDNLMEENSCSESESVNRKINKTKKRKQEPSIVDDKFFKMQELNEYLNREDRKESKEINKSKVNSDDESVDLFNDFSDNDDENEEEQNARLVKYADFFDSPESNEESENKHDISQQEENFDNEKEFQSDGESIDNQEQTSPAAKRVKFNLPLDSEESNESNNDSEREEKQYLKSSLEERQERINKKIKVLENEAISEKPWQLKGEVSASNRPQNSLLEDFVEVDVVSRPPPVITEQCTLDLEDIIRQRIKDKAWDDVEKKMKVIDTPTEYKKKLIMDQEKSKLSLAQIYEQEYVKQKQALDPEQNTEESEPKEHIEIKEMMHSVMKKLDALSNYHYTPIPVRIIFFFFLNS